jgi:predicted deacetylase
MKNDVFWDVTPCGVMLCYEFTELISVLMQVPHTLFLCSVEFHHRMLKRHL